MICVGGLLYTSVDRLALSSPHHIQHGQITFTVFFHSESNILILAVDVFEQTFYMVFLLYSGGVINVPPPWRVGVSGQGLDHEHLHKHVNDRGGG